MTEHDDLEARLKAFDHDPAPRVRRAALAAHRVQHGRAPFWRRGVPLYAVAALLVMAVGLTWIADRASTNERRTAMHVQPAVGDTALVWTTAARDQI